MLSVNVSAISAVLLASNAPVNVVTPVTFNALDNVASPVTPNVPPTLASAVTSKPVPVALLNVNVSAISAVLLASNAPVNVNELFNTVAPPTDKPWFIDISPVDLITIRSIASPDTVLPAVAV